MIPTDANNQVLHRANSRPDIHNAGVDEELAARDLCGMKHLATGDACLLPQRHPGGCTFTSPAARVSAR